MSTITRYSANTRLAEREAGRFAFPGMDADDVLQEARVALWEAAKGYDDVRGVPFTAFARMVIRRRLTSALRMATTRKSDFLSSSVREISYDGGETISAPEAMPDHPTSSVEATVCARETLAEIVACVAGMSVLQREALLGVGAGKTYDQMSYVGTHKQIDNAIQRAHRKLAKVDAC